MLQLFIIERPPHYIHLLLNSLIISNDSIVLAPGSGSDTAEINQTSVVATEESLSAGPAEELAIRLAVASIVGADPVLGQVAEGSWCDGAEEDGADAAVAWGAD